IPGVQRGRVDERLERAARLPLRLRRAVELRVVEVATADEREHIACGGFHDYDCALEIRRALGPVARGVTVHGRVRRMRERSVPAGLDAPQCLFQLLFRGTLRVQVERRMNRVALRVECRTELILQLAT